MAQADSVPTAIRPPLTGARSNPFTKSRFAGWLYPDPTPVILPIDDLDDVIYRLVLGHDQATLIRRWQEIEALSENSTPHPNTSWHYLITGSIPVGSYAAAVCYATTVIYLGWYPWNFLLLGLLFLIRNKPLHARAFVWCSSRIRMLIGLADRRVIHFGINSMKVIFAESGDRR
jgi:hypothetical protein